MKIHNRVLTYIILVASLFVGYLVLRDVAWQGTKQLHTLMEIVSSLLALLIGIMALLQYYSKKNNTFLLIGTGFLGTSCLDIYHTIVTSTFFDLYFPSPPPSLIPWSWIASRIFLAISLWLSWIVWNRKYKLN
ncbi:MASE3 domain-containing protein [Thiotrichales bacterium HSG1]|nr:MASE3 domain-containing protein [Thiotrichales bacterium HSG1]